MSRFVELISSRRAPHFVVLALVSVGFGGCSADTSTRFSDTSFSNPFASRNDAPQSTGSVPQTNYQQPPRELPQYSRPRSAPVISAPLSAPVATSGGGRGMASYAPPSSPIEATGSVAPRSVAATSGYSREGGTTIIVGTADTLDVISKRYNVPSAEILKANGYGGPRVLQPGQQLIIPRRTANAAPPALSPAPGTKIAAGLPASVHVVKPGDTLMNLSRRHNIAPAQLAAANHIPVTTQLKIGSKINIPGGKAAAAVPAPQVVADVPKPAAAPVAAAPAAKPVAVAQATEPQQKARVATEATDLPEAQSPVKAADATNALPTFRWPVRGRVITAYGAKTNGKQNDGINVAVPEGTPVKAAEDGVVAYSGNELKGYGNLILVRHSNGYVTAYAHASELMVKRGDTIKRGQVIAKSGQTGEVGSPQLHFEIRKGSSAVDPLQFLNGA
ncbi:peptidoglycan DD-metalloendopeptidase family protein [Bradyrhizobium sp. G127]|uniref:peptidoglycan DD-metalloendopeptidase family protein n=1 Tax=Bradyrhizobium sp. G127 TaxID=2904800 RepID=UPI001F1BAA66|nr:peptidoglycan DD-metalloendopeptidase family protein [Bradyrhizobium sp. G127]MCF2523727.1 peptidoglycan DD-metalloendopeptidase family protein [Bradyrhizobium sp. G127]